MMIRHGLLSRAFLLFLCAPLILLTFVGCTPPDPPTTTTYDTPKTLYVRTTIDSRLSDAYQSWLDSGIGYWASSALCSAEQRSRSTYDVLYVNGPINLRRTGSYYIDITEEYCSDGINAVSFDDFVTNCRNYLGGDVISDNGDTLFRTIDVICFNHFWPQEAKPVLRTDNWEYPCVKDIDRVYFGMTVHLLGCHFTYYYPVVCVFAETITDFISGTTVNKPQSPDPDLIRYPFAYAMLSHEMAHALGAEHAYEGTYSACHDYTSYYCKCVMRKGIYFDWICYDMANYKDYCSSLHGCKICSYCVSSSGQSKNLCSYSTFEPTILP